MDRPFLPHQAKAWEYVRTRDKIALFMRMRLGKSIVTIRWVKHRLPKTANVLIIAPTSVLHGWKDELRLEGEDGTILHGTSRQKLHALEKCETRFVLMNPEGFVARRKKRGESRPAPSAVTQAITSIAWDAIILDESTFMTKPQSAITQLIRREFKDVQCKAILAGEPAPESDLDFFEPMAFLFGSFMGSRTYYQFRFRNYRRGAFEWYPRTADWKKRLRSEIRSLAFVLTGKQAGATYPRIYQRRYVHLSRERQRDYSRIRRDFGTDDLHTKWAIVTVGWLSRMAGGVLPTKGQDEPFSTHKLDELCYLVCDRFPDEQLVVWFRYTDEIRFSEKMFERENISCRSIHGRTPLFLRHAYQKAFNAKKFRILLVQTKCARFGLDFRAANTAIYYSNWWDWLTRAQSEARIEHPTKVGTPLLYIDLVTDRTYDEPVLDQLQAKRTNSRYFLQKVMVRYESLARRRSWSEDDGIHGSQPNRPSRPSRSHHIKGVKK